MPKKIYHVSLDPAVHKRLRVKAANLRLTLGDVIEGCLDIVEASQEIEAPEYQSLFQQVYTKCFIDVGWCPPSDEEEAELEAKMARFRTILDSARKPVKESGEDE